MVQTKIKFENKNIRKETLKDAHNKNIFQGRTHQIMNDIQAIFLANDLKLYE